MAIQGTKLPLALRSKIKEMLLNGENVTAIAKELGCNWKTANKYVAEFAPELESRADAKVENVLEKFADLNPKILECAIACFNDPEASHGDKAKWGMLIAKINGMIVDRVKHSGSVAHLMTWQERAAPMAAGLANMGITVKLPEIVNHGNA